METITTQGVAIPRLGFGTFRMPGADAQPVVESAIALGYRHIDTAAMYDNETEVGAAIAASGVNRNELFITTKVWHDQLVPDALYRAFHTSLRKLRLDQVDLYMKEMDVAATLEADVAAGARPGARDRRVQLQPADDPSRGGRDRRAGCQPPGRISPVPVAGTDARLSARQGDSADSVCAPRARAGGK